LTRTDHGGDPDAAADRGITTRFITRYTPTPYRIPHTIGLRTRNGRRLHAARNTPTMQKAMKKCSATPRIPVVQPPANAARPSSPEAMLWKMRTGATPLSPKKINASRPSRMPTASVPPSSARPVLRRGGRRSWMTDIT
jgi:hypothetical protein